MSVSYMHIYIHIHVYLSDKIKKYKQLIWEEFLYVVTLNLKHLVFSFIIYQQPLH